MKKLIVKSDQQIAELWNNETCLKSYKISTAKNGLGCEANSFCTPTGKLLVAQKIGGELPINSILKARIPTGEIWNQSDEVQPDDLVLTRILWLKGSEDSNQNTINRHIYLHGTNHEDKLGTPVSHGCIRFSNNDIIEIFDYLEIDSEVFVA